MARLAVISDTHLPRGGRALPAACLEQLRTAAAILHAGDLMELTVLEELEAIGPPVHAVRGNVDSAELQARLPLTRIVQIADVRIAMVHDSGPADGRLNRLRRRFPEADAVVFGHSHMPLQRSATASPSSTPARRPSGAGRRTTPWASPPWRRTASASSCWSSTRNGKRGSAVVRRSPVPVRVGGGDLPPTRNLR